MALNSGAVPFFAPTKLYSRFDGSIISNSSSSLSPKSLSSFCKLMKISFHTWQLPATVHVSSKLFSLLQQITKTRRHDECNEKLTSQIPFCRKLAAKMKAINAQFSCNAPVTRHLFSLVWKIRHACNHESSILFNFPNIQSSIFINFHLLAF